MTSHMPTNREESWEELSDRQGRLRRLHDQCSRDATKAFTRWKNNPTDLDAMDRYEDATDRRDEVWTDYVNSLAG